MQAQNPELSDTAYFPVNFDVSIYPALGFLLALEAQGMKYDVYGPTTLVKKLFKSSAQNCFTFDELEWNEEEDMKGLFKAALEGFLQITSRVETIWKESGKKPKLIIADFFAPYAKYLAEKNKIPLLVLYHIFFMDNVLDQSDWAHYEKEFQSSINYSMNESLIPLANKVNHKYNFRIETIKDLPIVGDQNISFLPKFLGEMISLGKENSYYIGPSFRCESNDDRNLDFDTKILDSCDLIYVCLGNLPKNADGVAYYHKLLKVFEGTEHKVLISGIREAVALSTKSLPKNIIVKEWVPQIQVLEHSKLFISQLGAGSFLEALGKGVPIVAIPNFAEQYINSVAMEKLNVGRLVKDKSPENIKKVMEEVLKDQSIRENCEKYKKMINPEASRNKFIEIVKSMLKKY